jgi:sensor histidine kinase YesM
MHSKKDLFSDKWILIIGIPLIGISFPFFFGLKYGDPKFYSWIFISFTTTLISWLGTRQTVTFIWKRFPWESDPLWHIVVGMLLLCFYSLLTISLIYLLNMVFFHPGPGYLKAMKPIHTGVFIIFVFILLLHEAIHLFFKWKSELTHAADLEKENMRSKFEALKNHLNPHFLFNSLGTLSSLIRSDPEKAEKYVNEFSSIYRYFIEVNNNDLVTVEEELKFISSYVFLQQIRFGDGFIYHDRVDKKFRTTYILPLTLELLIENAIKHNTTMTTSPLTVEIFADETRKQLVVRNNYQPRTNVDTTHTGLPNLEQRYVSYLGSNIRYAQEDGFFIVEIPMIPAES